MSYLVVTWPTMHDTNIGLIHGIGSWEMAHIEWTKPQNTQRMTILLGKEADKIPTKVVTWPTMDDTCLGLIHGTDVWEVAHIE